MIKEIVGRIEKEIAQLNFPEQLPDLYNPISYSLSAGGKRIRPLLLMISSRIFGVNDEASIHQALGIEIFHNFTLVHDDIMDNAPLRRGKPSVYKKWNQNTAILSGDVMFSLSLQEISKCDKELLPDVLKTFLDMTVKVCEGQQMDMDFEERTYVNMPEYIKMIELKTAYLLAGSLKIGAILGRASRETTIAMFDFGIKIGTAFQLMDDYLDVYGDPEKFGKQVGGDIIAGKKTFLFIETLKNLPDNDKLNFERMFASEDLNSKSKVEGIKEYYEKSGANEIIREKADKLLLSAQQILNSIEGNDMAKEELINLTLQLTNRDK